MKYQKRNWPKLIEAQGQTGKSVKAFCQENKINLSQFYQKRKQLSQKQSLVEIDRKPISQNHDLKISIGRITIQPGSRIDPENLKTVLKIALELNHALL